MQTPPSNEANLQSIADVVAAYVSRNHLSAREVPELIVSVHRAFNGLAGSTEFVQVAPEPAVPIKKSVTSDFVVCLECGKKFASMKRHLTGHDLTPQQYREKWNLPGSYSLVAAKYSVRRSKLAKDSGLGRQRA